MKEEIKPSEQYEKLRTIHSQLKDVMKKRIGGIPHFAGEPKDLPTEYYDLLEKVNDALYDAEEWICNNYEW